MNKNIMVGIYDWAHFALDDSFYPPDLPHDWKLSFYANEFESASINFDESVDSELLSEWIKDLPDSFQLSIAVSGITQLEQLREIIGQTQCQLSYLLVDAEERDILLQNNFWKSVLWPSPGSAAIKVAERLVDSATVWTPDNQSASSVIALLPVTDDKRLYREWIELWVQDNSQHQLTLWLDGATAGYSDVSDLRILVELMGY